MAAHRLWHCGSTATAGSSVARARPASSSTRSADLDGDDELLFKLKDGQRIFTLMLYSTAAGWRHGAASLSRRDRPGATTSSR